MVWPQLEILLHYLQIDALRTRVAAAVLAEKRCGRAPDWQSGALTCARCANEHLEGGERTSCQGIRTTVHHPRLSKVTHLIHGVAGSELVFEFDCDDVPPMFIALLAPLRFLASFFKIPPVSFV
jgi:hypothetical protein